LLLRLFQVSSRSVDVMIGDSDYPALAFYWHQYRVQRQERWIRLRQHQLPPDGALGGIATTTVA